MSTLEDLITKYRTEEPKQGDFSDVTASNVGEKTVQDLRKYYSDKVKKNLEITDKDLDLLVKAGWATSREVVDLLPEKDLARFEKVYKEKNRAVPSEAAMFGHSPRNLKPRY